MPFKSQTWLKEIPSTFSGMCTNLTEQITMVPRVHYKQHPENNPDYEHQHFAPFWVDVFAWRQLLLQERNVVWYQVLKNVVGWSHLLWCFGLGLYTRGTFRLISCTTN